MLGYVSTRVVVVVVVPVVCVMRMMKMVVWLLMLMRMVTIKWWWWCGGAGWLVQFKGEGEELSVRVPRGKRVIFQELLRRSIPTIMGWPSSSSSG
jgi:hypothetical protein